MGMLWNRKLLYQSYCIGHVAKYCSHVINDSDKNNNTGVVD